MTKEAAGIDTQPAHLADGLTDDYEYWNGEPLEALRKDKTALYVLDLRNFRSNRSHVLRRKYQTEAAPAENCEAVMLVTGAWKT